MTNIDLNGFLKERRDEYLSAFKLTTEKLSKEGKEYFIEALDEEAQSLESVRDGLFSFYRYDILIQEGDNYYEVSIDINPWKSKGECYISDRMHVLFESFAWNSCSIKFLDSKMNIEDITDWYSSAIKLEQNELGNSFNNAIHSLVSTDNHSSLNIDFGSIDIDSIENLFNIFCSSGIKELVVSSSYI